MERRRRVGGRIGVDRAGTGCRYEAEAATAQNAMKLPRPRRTRPRSSMKSSLKWKNSKRRCGPLARYWRR
jgi:hypothetical protein